MDHAYEQQLRDLRERLLKMAGMVEDMIARSMQALTERDPDLARRTISFDHRVNRAELDADELCMIVLAKRQPLASDLRFITITFKMVTDLERIGDLAVNICERAIDLSAMPHFELGDDVPKMSLLVQAMVRDAIDAFVEGDVDKAQAVIECDDEVDELYTRVFRQQLQIMIEDPSAIQRAIHVQSIAKWLERMGDHSTNLAEMVIFMVKGKDVRHAGKLV